MYATIFLILMSLGIALTRLKVFSINKAIFSSIGRVILGPLIGYLLILYFSGWHNSSFFSIPEIQEWIMAVPATAGARAIMIGIALGIIAQSFRIITGREKTILGD